MRVKIQSIADRGNLEKERVVIKVSGAVDIGDHLLLRTGTSGGSVNTAVRDAFWFPDELVAAEDLVVVYSKAGIATTRTLSGGRTAHFYYWKKTAPLWSDKRAVPVVLYCPEWETLQPEE
jgi:hypothetical protein